MTDRNTHIAGFIAEAGWAGCDRTRIAGDASNRSYDRLSNLSGETAILMDAPPTRGEDVVPFVTIAKYLAQCGLSAPEIYHQKAALGFLLIEDLGDAIFARLMLDNPTFEEPLYQAATDVLIDLHACPNLPLPLCDAEWLTEMSAPAFEWYAADADGNSLQRFRDVFYRLAKALDQDQKVVILRDYHAENLLWLPDRSGTAKVGLLDFQDALLGHPAYDLVSILQDARREVSTEIEAAMIAQYLAATNTDSDSFRAAYALLGAQRNLRILGIFARLCLRDGKAHYLEFVPRVWGYLMRNLTHPSLTPLATLIKEILPHPTPEHLEHLKSQCATRQEP